jgi:hypothetical protein
MNTGGIDNKLSSSSSSGGFGKRKTLHASSSTPIGGGGAYSSPSSKLIYMGHQPDLNEHLDYRDTISAHSQHSHHPTVYNKYDK